MKKINLRGISETLNESEMKKVMGGDDGKKKEFTNEPEEPKQTVEEAACNGIFLFGKCKLTWSGGEATGQCIDKGPNGYLSCRTI